MSRKVEKYVFVPLVKQRRSWVRCRAATLTCWLLRAAHRSCGVDHRDFWNTQEAQMNADPERENIHTDTENTQKTSKPFQTEIIRDTQFGFWYVFISLFLSQVDSDRMTLIGWILSTYTAKKQNLTNCFWSGLQFKCLNTLEKRQS